MWLDQIIWTSIFVCQFQVYNFAKLIRDFIYLASCHKTQKTHPHNPHSACPVCCWLECGSNNPTKTSPQSSPKNKPQANLNYELIRYAHRCLLRCPCDNCLPRSHRVCGVYLYLYICWRLLPFSPQHRHIKWMHLTRCRQSKDRRYLNPYPMAHANFTHFHFPTRRPRRIHWQNPFQVARRNSGPRL